MSPNPNESAPQPPTKRRKKPATSTEPAASWESTRFFHQPKPALPTIQVNGVVKRSTGGPTLKAPSLGRSKSTKTGVVKRQVGVKQAGPSANGDNAMKSIIGANKASNKSNLLARSKSVSRLGGKPISSELVGKNESSSSQLRRKRSSATIERTVHNETAVGTTGENDEYSKVGEKPLKRHVKAAATSTQSIVSVEKLKRQIASLATRIVTDPHENVGKLSQLRQIAIQNRGKIAALALLTEAQVYRDIAPGYRIRTITEKEASVKVSKEVAHVRAFEQSLLSGFRRFIKSCTSLSRFRAAGNRMTVAAKEMLDVRHAACKALCTVLSALPHFNEADGIASAVVELVGDREADIRTLGATTLTELLSNAHKASGPVAQTCITAAKALGASAEGRKARVVSEETLQPLSEINFAAFARVPIGKQGGNGKDGKGGPGSKGKLSKRKREMLAKKNRKKPKDEEKLAAEDKADLDLEKDIAEAEADATPQETLMVRKALLDAVCTACFNVIKTASADAVEDDKQQRHGRDMAKPNGGLNNNSNISKRKRKPPPALSPALRGLLRIARYVGPDLIDAIVAALVPLLEKGPYPLSLRLRCATVAYEIVSARNAAGAMGGAKAGAQSSKKAAVADQTLFETDAAALDSCVYGLLKGLCGSADVRALDEEMVIQDLLEVMYAATSSRKLPAARAAAFARRLAIVACAAAPTHGCAAGLVRSAQVLFDPSMTMPVSVLESSISHDDDIDQNEDEGGKGKGQRNMKERGKKKRAREDTFADLGLIEEFDLRAGSADAANAARSIAWELSALEMHFHPAVQAAARECINGICGERLPKRPKDENAVVIAQRHSDHEGGFNPLPQDEYRPTGSNSKQKMQKIKDNWNQVLGEEDSVILQRFGGGEEDEETERENLRKFGDGDVQDDNGEYVDWCDGYFMRAFEENGDEEEAIEV